MKILRLWGIPICKILSDTEFVEKNRKGLRLARKLLWIHVTGLVFLAVLIPMLWRMIGEVSKEAENWAWAGLICGLAFGIVISNYIGAAVHAIFVALDLYDFNRGTRLLIKYHDTLREMGAMEEGDGQQDEQLFHEA